MLKLLRQQIQRWQDKRDNLDYFRKIPTAAIMQSNVKYRQALVAIESDPAMYAGLTFQLYAEDAKNDWKLLRAMVAHDPVHIRRARDQDNIPVDLLLDGLQSAEIWGLVKWGWCAYNNPAFIAANPDIVNMITMFKTLEVSDTDCLNYYKAWLNGKPLASITPAVKLPVFD